MHTFDGKEYATDDVLVEAIAATLELPRGLVDTAQVNQWQDGLDARGWAVAERTANRYRLRHTASDFLADLQLLRYSPDDPDHPVMDDTADDDDQLRSAFGTVRLSAPSDHGLIADANLTQAGHGAAVTWLITHIEPTKEEPADSVTTASPFEGASDDATTGPAHLLGELVSRKRDTLSIAIMLVTFLLVGMTTWVALRRSHKDA